MNLAAVTSLALLAFVAPASAQSEKQLDQVLNQIDAAGWQNVPVSGVSKGPMNGLRNMPDSGAIRYGGMVPPSANYHPAMQPNSAKYTATTPSTAYGAKYCATKARDDANRAQEAANRARYNANNAN